MSSDDPVTVSRAALEHAIAPTDCFTHECSLCAECELALGRTPWWMNEPTE